MMFTRVVPIVAVLGLVACSSADILRLDPTPRPRTNPASIQLIGQEPTRPYKVIAIVAAQAASLGTGDRASQARGRLLKEAARLGGHAVLLDSNSLTRIGGDESERQQLTGKVIVYTDSTGSN
jgi:hypothetical protein